MKLAKSRFRFISLLCAGGITDLIARAFVSPLGWTPDRFFLIFLFFAIAISSMTKDDDSDDSKDLITVSKDDGLPIIPRRDKPK